MIDQLTVFLENKEGHLASMYRTLADAGVNLAALTIAETSDYGLVRIICDDPERARKVLVDSDFRATLTKVAAIEIPNEAGSLARLLEVLEGIGLNIEYGYCFSVRDDRAVDVFKITGHAKTAEATFALEKAGFKALQAADLF